MGVGTGTWFGPGGLVPGIRNHSGSRAARATAAMPVNPAGTAQARKRVLLIANQVKLGICLRAAVRALARRRKRDGVNVNRSRAFNAAVYAAPNDEIMAARPFS